MQKNRIFCRQEFYFATAFSYIEQVESMKKKRMELLAPAGSMESLKAAIHAGADAVYMGGSCFGARAYADNPEGDRLLTAIED